MITPYSKEIEAQMQALHKRLPEKNRRLYAGVEALKLPYGGVSYIARLFDCSRDTILRGIKDLGKEETLAQNRSRHRGGGRQPVLEKHPDINEVFLRLLSDHTAGDPMDEKIKWTNLSCGSIGTLLAKKGFKVSRNIVRKLLKKHGYVKRQALKKKSTGASVNRNAQFERIAELKKSYEAQGNPVVSVDTKKKEPIGNLHRKGKIYTTETIEVFDHDFPSLAEGVAIPHTIYDLARNEAYVCIGTSRDTSEFACDSIRQWWKTHGKLNYSEADSILMLMDGGGSNSSRHYIFKQDLQALSDEIGVTIRIAHYPPYTSQWNPIEHRVFPHITRALQGVILTTHQLTKELIETTTTQAGLRVIACIINRVYKTGRQVAKGFKKNMRIVFDKYLKQWNYSAVPEKLAEVDV